MIHGITSGDWWDELTDDTLTAESNPCISTVIGQDGPMLTHAHCLENQGARTSFPAHSVVHLMTQQEDMIGTHAAGPIDTPARSLEQCLPVIGIAPSQGCGNTLA
jgi:hypothetical protein